MSCLGTALLLLGVVAVVRSVTATIVSMRWLASSVRVWRRDRPSGDGRPLGGSRTSPKWVCIPRRSQSVRGPASVPPSASQHLRRDDISDDGFIFTPDLPSAGLTCRLVPPLSKEARFCLGERIGFSIHAFEREVTRVPTEVASLDRRVALPTINSGEIAPDHLPCTRR